VAVKEEDSDGNFCCVEPTHRTLLKISKQYVIGDSYFENNGRENVERSRKDDLHSDWFLEFAALLDLEHEVSPVHILHHKVQAILHRQQFLCTRGVYYALYLGG
jgi:hypothetical protein